MVAKIFSQFSSKDKDKKKDDQIPDLSKITSNLNTPPADVIEFGSSKSDPIVFTEDKDIQNRVGEYSVPKDENSIYS